MPDGINAIAVPQLAETFLFKTRPEDSFSSHVFKTEGYARVVLSFISDQPFSVDVYEANCPEGPFLLTSTHASAPASGLQALFASELRFGAFMRVDFSKVGGGSMSRLSAAVYGVGV
jgi:hypothetical protein